MQTTPRKITFTDAPVVFKTGRREDFGEGYGKVPQETLDYFHELEEENMKVLAIEMTPNYCKGVIYEVNDAEAVKGIQDGIFQNAALNAIIDKQHEQQETYFADGSDKITEEKPKKK